MSFKNAPGLFGSSGGKKGPGFLRHIVRVLFPVRGLREREGHAHHTRPVACPAPPAALQTLTYDVGYGHISATKFLLK
jgi:hypothetical protein